MKLQNLAPYKTHKYEEPGFDGYAPWSITDLKTVATNLNNWEFESLGNLVTWLCTHHRVSRCNLARSASLISDTEFSFTGGTPAENAQLEADWHEYMMPVLGQIMTWMRFANCCLVKIDRENEDGAPIPQPWNLAFLSREGQQWQITAETTATLYGADGFPIESQMPIAMGQDWLFVGTERNPKPWHELDSAWNVVAPMVIGGTSALVYWLRNAMHSSISPVQVLTDGQYTADKQRFFEELKSLGQVSWIEMPFGMSLERLASAPSDYMSAAELKREEDMSIAEFLSGHSLIVRMEKGGSYAAVEAIISRIAAPMLNLELFKTIGALNRSWVKHVWRKWRGVSSPVKVGFKVTSLDDALKLAQIEKLEAETKAAGEKKAPAKSATKKEATK